MQHQSLYSFLIVSVFSLAAVTQDLSQLPSCAQTPALSSISSTGCQLTDFACICKNSSFIDTLTPIVQKDCSPADIQKVSEFSAQLCGSVGVTVSAALSATAAQPTVVSTKAAAGVDAGASQTTGSSVTTSTSGTPSAPSAGTPSAGTPTSNPSSGASVSFDGRSVAVMLFLSGIVSAWLGGF